MIDASHERVLRQAIEDLYFGYRAFTALPDRMLAEQGLARAHHRILYFVHRQPGVSVGELVSTLAVTKQALHRPLKDLERVGLIEVSADDSDRRVRRVRLTPRGERLETDLTSSQMHLLLRAFDGLDASALDHWHAIMTRLAGDEVNRGPADADPTV